jgi:hypothetical protein
MKLLLRRTLVLFIHYSATHSIKDQKALKRFNLFEKLFFSKNVEIIPAVFFDE